VHCHHLHFVELARACLFFSKKINTKNRPSGLTSGKFLICQVILKEVNKIFPSFFLFLVQSLLFALAGSTSSPQISNTYLSRCGLACRTAYSVADLGALEAVPWIDEPLHRKLFENPIVRIYEAVILPGESTLFHEHTENTVYVTVEDGGNSAVENTIHIPGLGTQAPCPLSTRSGTSFCSLHKEKPLIHRISCPSTNEGPVHFIGMEVLSKPDPRERWTMRHLSYDLIMECDLARAYRLVLRSGEKTGMHAFNFCGLVVYLTGGDLVVSERAAPPKRVRAEARGEDSGPDGKKRCIAGSDETTAEATTHAATKPPGGAGAEQPDSDDGQRWQEDLAEWLRLPNDVVQEEIARLSKSIYPPPPQAGRIVDVQVRAAAAGVAARARAPGWNPVAAYVRR
jgi:hypothetical protein